MKFEALEPIISGVPHTPLSDCRRLYDFVLTHRPVNVLELGCAKGKTACVLAAALDELDHGQLVTIDRPYIRRHDPSVFDLLAATKLQHRVDVLLTPTSYNWELLKFIERQSRGDVCEPLFDFCFIDGAHSWETDGMAFFLVDKLLKPGGWILFDDIDWTYATSPSMKARKRVLEMPEDERTTPQVERILSLLVQQHPDYETPRLEKRWGWARKKPVRRRFSLLRRRPRAPRR